MSRKGKFRPQAFSTDITVHTQTGVIKMLSVRQALRTQNHTTAQYCIVIDSYMPHTLLTLPHKSTQLPAQHRKTRRHTHLHPALQHQRWEPFNHPAVRVHHQKTQWHQNIQQHSTTVCRKSYCLTVQCNAPQGSTPTAAVKPHMLSSQLPVPWLLCQTQTAGCSADIATMGS